MWQAGVAVSVSYCVRRVSEWVEVTPTLY